MNNGEYIFARMDIVAFSALSESTVGADDVFGAFERISSDSNERIRHLNASVRGGSTLELKHYGDTVDVFFKSGNRNQSLILMLIDVVAEAQRVALNNGFFTKGAIVKGHLRFVEEGCTGQAMVAAHKIEQNCPYACISFTEEITELIDKVAHNILQTDTEIVDFKDNIIMENHYLNYLEACPFKLWKNIKPDLKIHKNSLTSTVARYCALPSDSSKGKEYVTMYRHALENHNRVSEKLGAREEAIKYNIEQTNGIANMIFEI